MWQIVKGCLTPIIGLGLIILLAFAAVRQQGPPPAVRSCYEVMVKVRERDWQSSPAERAFVDDCNKAIAADREPLGLR